MYAKDSRAESLLKSLGEKYRWRVNLKYSDMVPDWNTRNLGRARARNEEAILSYAARTEGPDGTPMPGGMVYMTSSGISPIDGVQRYIAGKDILDYTTFGAYVVEGVTNERAVQIRVCSNNRLQGSFQESQAWVIQQVIDQLIDMQEIPVLQAARMAGIRPEVLQDKKIISDWLRWIRNIGGPEKMSDGIVRVIDKNAKVRDLEVAPEPIALFLHDLTRCAYVLNDARPHVEEFFDVERKRRDLHAQFVRKLAAFHGDSDVATRLADPRKRRHSPRTGGGKLSQSLKAALTVAEKVRDGGEIINYVEEFRLILHQIERVLDDIETQSKHKAATAKKKKRKGPNGKPK